MNCPRCKTTETRVIGVTPTADAVRRRRECAGCGHRFNSFETTEDLAGKLHELEKRLGPVIELVNP
jgi:transcriptional regulator NrdR family protein